MTKLVITHAQYWTNADGTKVKQTERMICSIVKEDANWIEFSVDTIDCVDNAAPFYKASTGGAVMKRTLNGYQGKSGMFTVALA